MLCHADSTHSWQHAQLTANDFPSQLNQLIKKFADQLISHAADSFWWFPTQQKDSADFLRDRQLLQLMQLISHAAKRWSWFPAFQTASDSADLPCVRQLLLQLIFYVADSFGFGCFHMCRQLQICWFSWFQNLAYGLRVSWFSTWQKASDSADFQRDRQLQDSSD